MFLSFVTIFINGFQWIFRFDIYNANYISFSFISTILYMFTQSVVMFYLIGAGKKIKELIIEYDIDKSLYEKVIKIKRVLFPPLTINMLIIGTGFILGGGVQTKVISKYWHFFVFYFGLFHYLKVIILQHKALSENADILSDLGKQIYVKE
tara:strand:- start:663 stop:1115 length:453 start_codon:yes stop_codon:yes gene_type:complete